MNKTSDSRLGQSTLEYAVVIVIVIAAALAMQIYMKRGIQGKLRAATDDIGGQYVPGQRDANYTVSTLSHRNEIVSTDGGSKSKLLNDEKQTRHGRETLTTSDTMW